MANEFVTRNGLIILSVPTGSTSNQSLVWNTTTKKVEVRTEENTLAGKVSNTSFTGTPYTYDVIFGTSLSSTDYAVVITGGDARSWTVENQTASGFRINSNSNTSLSYSVYWIANLSN